MILVGGEQESSRIGEERRRKQREVTGGKGKKRQGVNSERRLGNGR